MAYRCVKNSMNECDGCGDCEEADGECNICGYVDCICGEEDPENAEA